ncbi:protein EFR3 homolog B isoform X2 [Lethenteron reissneri]|uniref:protein EFR3 homolog B isoform X2 n=1 Tax=Lethenteron reissneri TaxID=7753 RepID=UPI002AB70A2D|nr:protein EFR3 homolog B isoform X2 [Lethenteron reissneri]
MSSVCGCCGALRPRYKQLVDNIFPEDPAEGLMKANMEKLTFYALSAPEKLDRIGAYLAERLSRDVARHYRHGYVFIAMEALDQLLMACHSQSINLFVESFLRMVAKLLECSEPEMQVLGTNSFVKFANIEEDTPSYHRRYDFFVSKFSAMCHQSHDDPDATNKVRMAGIRGLQGVVRKTVKDELQADIWEPQHMDKIVPSLLYNMQHADPADSRSPSPLQVTERERDSPACLGESCLRDLLGRAAYGNIKNVIRPVLVHLDNHQLWDPNAFAVRCFKIVMYSIQAQHSHLVLQQLLGHLDTHSKDSARVRAGLVQVLAETVAIAAGGSVGPTVLEVCNTLLRHVRLSVDFQLTGRGGSHEDEDTEYEEEKMFQESLIKTIGSFATTLPNYQRSEIMFFIMGKMPLPGCQPSLCAGHGGPDSAVPFRETLFPPSPPWGPSLCLESEEAMYLIQTMLLRSVLQVTCGYHVSNMTSGLPSSFLEPLLSLSLLEHPDLRVIVMEILQSLVDRHGNRQKFASVSIWPDIAVLNLKMEKCSRQDVLFMKKHSQQLYRYLYLASQREDNSERNFRALFGTLAVLSVELAGEEVVVDLVRLALAMQEAALQGEDGAPVATRCSVLALVVAYCSLLSQLTAVPAFCQHVTQVVDSRSKKAPYLLPAHVFTENPNLPRTLDRLDPELLLLSAKIGEALGGSGYSVERLTVPYVPQLTDEDRLSKRKSTVDTISIQVEEEAKGSPNHGQVKLPGGDRQTRWTWTDNAADRSMDRWTNRKIDGKTDAQKTPAEEITFESLKKAIVDSASRDELERERRRQVMERFQKAPFEEIAAQCEARANLLQNKLNQIFEMTIRPPPSPSGSVGVGAHGPASRRSVPVYEMSLPDLCVY